MKKERITHTLTNPFNIIKEVFDGITLLRQQNKYI